MSGSAGEGWCCGDRGLAAGPGTQRLCAAGGRGWRRAWYPVLLRGFDAALRQLALRQPEHDCAGLVQFPGRFGAALQCRGRVAGLAWRCRVGAVS